MFEPIDILEELKKEQSAKQEKELLNEAQVLLNEASQDDQRLLDKLYGEIDSNSLVKASESFEPENLFSEASIESICTKYRMRFLKSKLFKGDIPYEAILRMKAFERQYGQVAQSYKIVAPSELFQLKDSTKDPLLFAQLKNGTYYLIHQWGNDMSWYRKILLYPFRDMTSLGVTAIVVALLFALIIPADFYYARTVVFFRIFVFACLTCMFYTGALILGILYEIDFSNNEWRSKFLK